MIHGLTTGESSEKAPWTAAKKKCLAEFSKYRPTDWANVKKQIPEKIARRRRE